MILHTYKTLIRETHLDTFGHINNAAYLELYEEARWEAIVARGYGLPEVMKFQKGPVILECQIKFLKEIRCREELSITVEVIDYSGLIGSMKQQMIKSNGVVASEATFKFGFFDLQTRKLILPSPEWAYAVGMDKN